MTEKTKSIVLVTLGVLLAFLVYKLVGRQSPSSDLEVRIQSLQERIDTLEMTNIWLDRRISEFQQSIDSLDAQLDLNSDTITVIQHHYDQIPNRVNNLSNSELRREFADY